MILLYIDMFCILYCKTSLLSIDSRRKMLLSSLENSMEIWKGSMRWPYLSSLDLRSWIGTSSAKIKALLSLGRTKRPGLLYFWLLRDQILITSDLVPFSKECRLIILTFADLCKHRMDAVSRWNDSGHSWPDSGTVYGMLYFSQYAIAFCCCSGVKKRSL